MKKTSIFLFMLVIFMWNSNCSAFWVWTPQTKKWINPKYAPKANPEEQFDYAKSFFDNGNYKLAAAEFEKLINSFSNSSLAPEAGYYSGLAYQKNEDYYKAFLIYSKVLTQYPHSKRISQIIENTYQIGEIFFEGKKRKLMGLEILSSLTTAEGIFKSIIDNAPYSEYGDKAQFKLGECYGKMNNYRQAVIEFEKVVKSYPESQLANEAQYKIAFYSLMVSMPSDYEQETTDEAIEKFENFIKDSPSDKEMIEEAKIAINGLKGKKAKHEYEIASFYENNRKYESAVIYYDSVVRKYPGSEWALLAKERLEGIKNR